MYRSPPTSWLVIFTSSKYLRSLLPFTRRVQLKVSSCNQSGGCLPAFLYHNRICSTACALNSPDIASARRSSCPIIRSPGFVPIVANAHSVFAIACELNSPDMASALRCSMDGCTPRMHAGARADAHLFSSGVKHRVAFRERDAKRGTERAKRRWRALGVPRKMLLEARVLWAGRCGLHSACKDRCVRLCT